MSKSFMEVVCNKGSLSVDCRHGIVWFTREDEDVESLRKKQQENPVGYRESDQHSVSWGLFEGHVVVWECAKCKERIEKIAEFLLENEELIRKFFKSVSDARIAEAKRLAELV